MITPSLLNNHDKQQNDEFLQELEQSWCRAQQRLLPNNPDYNSITLNQSNKDRSFYLPCFPHLKSTSIDQIPLLLSNMPAMTLNTTSLYRRYGAFYDGPFVATVMNRQMDSFMKNLFKFYFRDLMERLQISISLIDFNLARFQNIIERFETIHRMFHQRFIDNTHSKDNPEEMSAALDFTELSIGLEFFLQIDVDLFYMKTCSFRGAQPRSFDEGLFCKADSPSVRYSFEACALIDCTLCESTSSLIQFNSTRMHRFVNGYHAILNCPTNCQTTNLIYTLTCPCKEYDFIGSTSSTIGEIIDFLQKSGNHFLHETLISELALKNLKTDPNHFLYNEKEKFRLYEHLVRCPKIIQRFLNVNPSYNCFIPMTYDEAMKQNNNNTTYPTFAYDAMTNVFMQQVPIPPSGYTFSNLQRYQQYLFFLHINQLVCHENTWQSIDLFDTTVIAVLPENSSNSLREIIACILCTHAETQLNMYNLRSNDTYQLYGPAYYRIWCEDIKRPE